MDILTPDKFMRREIQEDLDVLDENDENDPFIRPKKQLTKKQADNLKKGRETLRLKREQSKGDMSDAEREINEESMRIGRNLTLRERRNIERKYEIKPPTKKMPVKKKTPVVNDIIERVEDVTLTSTQEKKLEEIKQLSQEELDEKEFDKFIKMMDKFETMVSKMEEKKRKEQEEAERKEREMEEKYYKKFMERQQQKPQQSKSSPFVSTRHEPEQPVNDNPLGLTDDEKQWAKYF